MATRQRCPKCNQLNDLGAAQCVHCGAPLIQVCPICGTPRPWYVERCAQCASQPNDTSLFTNLFGDAPSGLLKGRYDIQETLSAGPAGKVYRGTDRSQGGGEVILKALTSAALFRANEKRDAVRKLHARVAAWQAVDHDALVKIQDTFTSGDSEYVVMERIRGWSLANLITHNIPVTPMLARNWGAQLAHLLHHLHSLPQPLYAPFLAPGHVMVTPGGEIKLVGLGLSGVFQTRGGQPYGGTKGYVAPELASGYPTPQSDQFALARTLYATLIGRLLEQGLGRSIPLREAVPGIESQLVKTIAKGANRDPNKRYATAEDLGQALWGTRHGDLTPIAEWRQVSVDQQLDGRPTASASAQTPSSNTGPSMADLGFRADPRFGPGADDRTGRPAAQQQPSRRAASSTAVRPARRAPATTGTPIMSLHPTRLSLPDLAPDAKKKVVVRVRNQGNADLRIRLESRVAWITAPKQQVRIPPNKAAKVVVTVHAGRIPNGQASVKRALGVGSNTGTQWIAASAAINSAPVLQVLTRQLDFGDVMSDGQRSLSIRLANQGRQRLTGQALARVPWLRLERTSFAIPGGETIQLAARLDTAKLARGEQTAADAIVLESDGGQARIAARAWRRVPELDLGANHMAFGDVASGEAVERVLIVGNSGDAELQGAVRSLVPHLQVWPTEIACNPGDMEQISVSLDTTALPDGPLHIPQAVRVQTNGGSRTLGLDARVLAPKLVVETERLDYETVPLGEQAMQFVRLANHGSAPLQAEIASLVPWLAIQQEQVALAPHSQHAVPVVLRADAFESGQQIEVLSAVRITSGSRMIDLSANVHILQPALQIEPESVDFGYVDRSKPEQRNLAITNAGTGSLAWQAQWDAEWVEVLPASGICGEGETQNVSLTAYGLAVEASRGQQTNTLIITSDGGRAKVPLRVGLAEPMIATDMRYVDMVSVNRGPATTILRIFNHGLGTLEGSIQSDSIWLAVDRVSFSIEMGRSAEVHLTADLDELPADATEAQGTVSLSSNGGDVSIEVALRVELHADIAMEDHVALKMAQDGLYLVGRLPLKNNGMGSGHIELAASHAEIALTPAICDIRAGRRARVSISVPAALVASGEELWVEATIQEETTRVPLIVDSAQQ